MMWKSESRGQPSWGYYCGGKAGKSGGLESRIEEEFSRAQGKVSPVKHSCESVLPFILFYPGVSGKCKGSVLCRSLY